MPIFVLSDQAVFNTVVFLTVLFLLRWIIVRIVTRSEKLSVETRRRLKINIRNATLFLLLAGLVFIWAPEIRTFAVSLVAIAVAIVIATKELILCFSGSVLRTATNAYSIGDRIEINGMRGDVIDVNWFATTLLEAGPGKATHQYTGKAVVFPHSQLLTHSVSNESFMGEYVVHPIVFPLSVKEDWRRAEALLLEAAGQECAPYMEDARRHMETLRGKQWIDTPSVDPRITVEIAEPGILRYTLRIPAPERRKGRVEQAILRRFLDAFYPPDTRSTGSVTPRQDSSRRRRQR